MSPSLVKCQGPNLTDQAPRAKGCPINREEKEKTRTAKPAVRAKGRLTSATTTASGSVKTGVVYSYDGVGRVGNFWQCSPVNCGTSMWNVQYNYDWAGDVLSWVRPGVTASFTLTNTINPAQQITAIQSSWQDTSHPQYLAQNITYTPWGAVSGLQNGCVGSGCTVEQETYQYNQLLQPWVISLTAGSGGYCLVYNYYSTWTQPSSCPAAGSKPPTGTTDNGSVMNYWDSDSYPSGFSHTMSYTYDHVNRLATATAKSLAGSTLWSYAYSYDRWGNGTCTQGGVDCPSLTYNSNNNNQLASIGTSSFSYDAAGELTTDSSNALATHTYQWDAEGRVSVVDPGSSPTWSFTYNAVGDRVTWTHSGSADQHIFDPAGNFLGVNSVWDFAWLGGRVVTVYLGSNTYFNHANHLGSTTAWADYTGKQVEDLVFYPWGGVWQYSGSGGYMFAGMPYYETTTETSPANYRFYSMNLGRWHSPDPASPDLTNPQSLNRYAYVMNNHTSLTDPLGLDTGQGSDPYQGGCDCNDPNCVNAACGGPGWPPGFWPWPPGNGGGFPGGGGPTVSLPTGNVGSGLPPGMGNAAFGGLITCTQVSIVIAGVPYPGGPLNCTLNLPGGGRIPIQLAAGGAFSIALPFAQAVQAFAEAGVAPSALDNAYNPFHGTDYNMRDFNPVCSAHVTLNVNSGQLPGQATTGTIHSDAFNPTFNVPLYPLSGEAVQGGELVLHGVADVAPWWIGTKIGLSIPGAGSLCP